MNEEPTIVVKRHWVVAFYDFSARIILWATFLGFMGTALWLTVGWYFDWSFLIYARVVLGLAMLRVMFMVNPVLLGGSLPSVHEVKPNV